MSSLTPQLDGYRDLELIAHGTTSLVFRATQERLNRTVAVKLLLGTGMDTGGTTAAAVARELETMVRLSAQPHIVSIIDTGTTPEGRPYTVMEYCEDGSYAQILSTRGPLPVDDVVEVGIAIGEALHAAHQAGIIHRDVKPSNILRSRFGPALADFGIARAPDELAGTLTREMMTPHHASPEALLHQAQSSPSDVYSLASTLWTLLVGHPPMVNPAHPDMDLYAFRDKVLHDPLPPMPRDDVPAWLLAELTRAMAKIPAQRHGTAREFADALRRGSLGLSQAPPTTRPTVVPSRHTVVAAPPADGGPLVHSPGLPANAWPTHAAPPAPEPAPPPAAPPPPAEPAPAARWHGPTTASAQVPAAPAPPSPAALPAEQPWFPTSAAPPHTTHPGPVAPTEQPAAPPQRLPHEQPFAPTQRPLREHPVAPAQRGPQEEASAPRRPADRGAPHPLERPASQVPPTGSRPDARSAAGAPMDPFDGLSLDSGGWAAGPAQPRPAPAPLRREPAAGPPIIAEPSRGGRPRWGVLVGSVVTVLLLVGGIAAAVSLANQGSSTGSGPHATATVAAPGASGAPGSAPAVPTDANGSPRLVAPASAGRPTNVKLVDNGTAVTVNWGDPSGAGTLPFAVSTRAESGEWLPAVAVAAGRHTTVVRGLDPKKNYCFTVTAIYSADTLAAAPAVCTRR